jgi:hypothetical protein
MRNFFKRNKVILIILIICVFLLSGYFSYSFLLNGNLFSKFLPTSLQYRGIFSDKSIDQSQSTKEGNSAVPGTTSNEEYKLSMQSGGTLPYSETSSVQFGLKIIKNGNMSILTDRGKFFETWQKIIVTAKSISGTIANSSYYKQGDYYLGFITVIVPSDQFDNFNEAVSKFGKVMNLSVSTQDVTGEYVDLSSKLKVLEEQRNLLLSWLKEAKTIDEMIKLRNEIQSVETDIETIKGRINYIAFHTDFSEITLNLSEKEESFKPAGFLGPLVDALKKLYETLVFSFFGLLIILAFILPWGLIGFLVYRLVLRRKK